jgi:hypothetical protein
MKELRPGAKYVSDNQHLSMHYYGNFYHLAAIRGRWEDFMNLAPFTAPTLAQMNALQASLAPLAERGSERPAILGANRALAADGNLAKSGLITLIAGDSAYLFRLRTDPSHFARLVVPPSQTLGGDFEVSEGWKGRNPLVIAHHRLAAHGKRVESNLFINVKTLVPVAARSGEYMEVARLKLNSDAARLIESLLWAGLGVFPADGTMETK